MLVVWKFHLHLSGVIVMAFALKIFDQTNAGQREPSVTLQLASERINARELLRQRVKSEVEKFNSTQSEVFQGLVQPTKTERVLNGFRLSKHRKLDWEKQFAAAVSAFDNGQIYLLIDDRQLESLDEEFGISTTTEVIFLKLVPLAGG